MKDYVIGSVTTECIYRMMLKDIDIYSAIFDLIDNSINAAEKNGEIKKCIIDMQLSTEKFLIKDNCGGILRKDIDKVLSIGNEEKDKEGFGVGMKRAIIKIGKKAEIVSINNDRNFKVSFDLSIWRDGYKWTIEKINNRKKYLKGLIITIWNLNDELRKNNDVDNVCWKLKDAISRRYKEYIKMGVKIILNEEEIEYYKINFKDGNDAESPTYSEDNVDIKIHIYNAKIINSKYYGKENGWNIYVNNRAICIAYKGTGVKWSEFIKENSKGYSFLNFVGEVFIRVDNIKDSIINSEKNRINYDHPTFKKILKQMMSFVLKHKALFVKKETTVKYYKPIEEVNKLKYHYGVNSASAVGRRSFEEELNRLNK